jgi:hypothetical protein
MSGHDDYDLAAAERRWRRQSEEEEQQRLARTARHRTHMRRIHRRRQAVAGAVLVLLLGVIAGAWSLAGTRSNGRGTVQSGARTATPSARNGLAVVRSVHVAQPATLRGIHISMYVAGQPSKVRSLFSLAGPDGQGLNAVEIDVKDERGTVGFTSGVPALARQVHAARPEYDVDRVVREAHAAGLYVIGRVVSFEDPLLATARPGLAIHSRSGGIWRNSSGVGWLNEYDRHVWAYLIGLGRAAAAHGFDEVQFDYVRFPTDGNLADAIWPNRVHEPYARTIVRFLTEAANALHPLGVRVSADVFGLAATRNLGIGQSVPQLGRVLDAVSPMAYPSHYGPGEFGLPSPDADPYDTVYRTMSDFRDALRDSPRTQIRPWLQDFAYPRPYTLADIVSEIHAAERAGASGWMLWNPSSVYTVDALRTG